MSANVLADKDINTSAPNTTKSADNEVKDVKSMEHHRRVLQSRLAEDGYVLSNRIPPSDAATKGSVVCRDCMLTVIYYSREKTTYISPSDMMMSPTTAKLADMRNKRFAK